LVFSWLVVLIVLCLNTRTETGVINEK
jgi:hypothetical protein